MKWDPITRRHFLQGAGKAMLTLPFLPSLLSKKLLAQAAPGQKSFIALSNHLSTFNQAGPHKPGEFDALYMPKFTNMTSHSTGGRHAIHSKSLTQAAAENGGALSDIFDSAFAPYHQKMTMIHGFDWLRSFGHNKAHFGACHTTPDDPNTPQMASIDQVMAYSSNFAKTPNVLGKSLYYGANTKLKYGVEAGSGGVTCSYTFGNPANKMGSIIPTTFSHDPKAVWDKFFAGFSAPAASASLKKTLVDQTYADAQSLKASGRLSSEDKQLLDIHLASLFQIESEINATQNACTRPPRPTLNINYTDVSSQDSRPATLSELLSVYKTMNSLVVALIQCGLCHSFALNPSDVDMVRDPSALWHAWTHSNDAYLYSGPNQTGMKAMNQLVVKDIGLDLVGKLNAVSVAGGGTLLDQSLMVIAQEMSSVPHLATALPFVLFGSAGGVIRNNLYIDYTNVNLNPSWENSTFYKYYVRYGYPVTQAFANFLMAMDVPKTEFEALNRVDSQIISPRSGYSALSGSYTNRPPYMDNAYAISAYGSPSWANHDASAWLPLLKVDE